MHIYAEHRDKSKLFEIYPELSLHAHSRKKINVQTFWVVKCQDVFNREQEK